MIQNWYKSWALWLAIAAFIVFAVKEFFKLDIADSVNGLLNVLLPILILLGIVNNPTNKSGIGTIASNPEQPNAPNVTKE